MNIDDILIENKLLPGETYFVWVHRKDDAKFAHMIRAGMWNDGLNYTDTPKPSALFNSKEQALAGLESWKKSAYKDMKMSQRDLKAFPKRARAIKNQIAKYEAEAKKVEKELNSLRLAVIETKITII